MARVVHHREEVEVPSDVTVEVTSDRRVVVRGPLGEIEKDFSHVRNVLLYKEDSKVVVETFFADKRTYAVVGTIASKIRNMIEGVRRGFRYKMRVVYAHFPPDIKVDERKGVIIITNFLGRKKPITVRIAPGAKVKLAGKKDIIIEGVDIEAVGQTAANIHLAVKLRGKERLCPHGREGGPGVLDGIYIYAKEHIR